MKNLVLDKNMGFVLIEISNLKEKISKYKID